MTWLSLQTVCMQCGDPRQRCVECATQDFGSLLVFQHFDVDADLWLESVFSGAGREQSD